MSLRAAEDASPAEWVVESLTTFGDSVASVLPTRFEAYARILHPARVDGHDGGPVPWAEIAAANGRTIHPEVQFPALVPPGTFDDAGNILRRGRDLWERPPDEGSLDLDIIRALIPLLRNHTTTPQHCYFAYWNGWGDPLPLVAVRSGFLGSLQRARAENEAQARLKEQFAGAPRGERDRAPSFATPHREWYLYEGTLDDAISGWYGNDRFHFQSASMWWPEDHAWFVSTEVDFDSTYVGGSRDAIHAILGQPSIEALEVDVGHGITWGSDKVNPNPHPKG